MANALAAETSPYLRQHAQNPVDWLPWGETALQRARAQDKPLLVSIGYSSCHWCHVMERESFEDERVAALMNEHFVCVKVDREERPDVDALYMEAVQALTGRGGWPLNVFLTPDQLPFYGGTYFPPRRTGGMPSFTDVLESIADAWQQREPEIREQAQSLRARLSGGAVLAPSEKPFQSASLDDAVERLAQSFDSVDGGFGGAPRFPQPTVIELLLSEAALGENAHAEQARTMALRTLEAIVSGGIHDVLGGGFHRYCVDARWSVPHFEKMLYDNALLARACLRGYALSGRGELRDACLDTLSWALREMRGPEGGFYSALDADAGGVEGAFYVWSTREMRELLGGDAEAAIAWLGAGEQGNFSDPHRPVAGLNVLSARGPAPDEPTRRRIRETLLRAREERVRPGLDDKRLTSWNALMISALAEAGSRLGEPALSDAAARCAGFVLAELRDERGRLLRTWSEGHGSIDAYLEDHAFMVEALLALYESSRQERWLSAAEELAREMIERFADDGEGKAGGFFSTARDATPLIARRKDLEDSPIPAGASSAALGLLRLAALTGRHRYREHAASALALLHEIAPRHPGAFSHLLQALRLHVSGIREIAVVGPAGPERDALLGVVYERPRPDVVVAVGDGEPGRTSVPLLDGRVTVDLRPTAYVCEHFTCRRPVTEPNELRALLDR